MITNDISFKGYKNILCAFDVPVADKSVSYIAMQLNDEDGVKDLSEYQKLRKMQGYALGQTNEDVLVLTYVLDKKNEVENLYMGTKDMYFGDELLQLEQKYVPKLMTLEKYQKEKTLHMKAYTLLASLTSRMMYQSFDKSDSDLKNVMDCIFDTINRLTKNHNKIFSQQDAFNILNTGCLKRVKFQDLATAFNKGIMLTMEKFFLR